MPKTRASSSTGHHWPRVNVPSRGLAMGSSTAAATNWRTTTTPTGPIAGKANEPTAAPTWLESALPSSVATPAAVCVGRRVIPRVSRARVAL
jgi:hypothetical protein